MKKLVFYLGLLTIYLNPNQAKGQFRYELVHQNNLYSYNALSPFTFYKTVTGFSSRFFNGEYLIGSDTSNSKILITKIKFDDNDIFQKTFELNYPEILIKNSEDGSLLINNSFETGKDTFQVFFENKFLITFYLNDSKAIIINQLDISKIVNCGFNNLFKSNNLYAAFKKVHFGKCVLDAKIDTAELNIYNERFELVKSFKLPDFESSFLNYGNTKYIDYKDNKILICSPLNFCITIFDFNLQDTIRINLSNHSNFNFKLIDSSVEQSIKKLYPSKLNADRLSTFLKLGSDTLNFVKKSYFTEKDQIQLIIVSNIKNKTKMSLGSVLINRKNSFNIIDTAVLVHKRFKEKVITRDDFPFESYQMEFNVNRPYIFVYGYDSWNSNIIGKKLNDIIIPNHYDHKFYRFKYYVLKSYD